MITAVVSNSNETIADFELTEVERTDTSISCFKAYYESDKLDDVDWKVGDKVTFTVSNGEYYDDVVFVFRVKEVKSGAWAWIQGIFGSDKVIFECVG